MSTAHEIHLDHLVIGPDRPPIFIAELSGNHDGDLDRALAIVDAMAGAGAHVLKLQTYTADTLTIDCDADGFVVEESDSLWHGRTLHDLYEEAHTPWDWHEPLFERARSHGMACFSSPFDHTAIEFLEQFDPPAYKIASFEAVDHELVAAAAGTARPLLISTGASTMNELDDVVTVARDAGCDDLVLLVCTSAYPALPEDANLAAIGALRTRYGCNVGLSDHTLGIAVPVAAAALGADLVEKHVTLARDGGGVDSAFSLEPAEVAHLVEQMNVAHAAVGRPELRAPSASSARFRRSLYVVEPVEAGEAFTRDNVRCIRPGFGLAPKHLPDVVGRSAAHDIERGTALAWDLVSDDRG